MSSVDFPYASLRALQVSAKDLAVARRLVAEELYARRAGELDHIRSCGSAAQVANMEELALFRDAMVSALDSDGKEEAVLLSPLSGRHRRLSTSTAGDRDAERHAPSFTTTAAPGVASLFPRIALPSSDDERAARRVQSHSKKRSRDADGAEGDGRNSNQEATSEEVLFSSASSTPPPLLSAPGAADAVYYETLLGQHIGAELFLSHDTLSQEGEAFLFAMQRTQELVFATRHQLEDTNALRFLEQREFAMAHNDLVSQVAKTRKKVAALEKTLGVNAGPESSADAGKTVKRVSLLTSLK